MNSEAEPLTIGIIGGMGPEATVDLYQKILEETNAEADQDHLPVIIAADPRVPDRSEAIIEEGENPVPTMVRSAIQCAAAGADFLIMPCNSAHYFATEVQKAVDIPLINMIREVAYHIDRNYFELDRVGVMATSGTATSGLYQNALSEVGIEAILPDQPQQEMVMKGIYAIKANRHHVAEQKFPKVKDHLVQKGARALIAGCTEIPLGLKESEIEPLPFIDATRILAQVAVDISSGERPIE